MTPNLDRLNDPFPAEDIEWRIGRSGLQKDGTPWAMVLAYVSARAGQQRFDEVFGKERWAVEYRHVGGGVICRLGAMYNDGTFLWKEDGAQETEIEPFKGGISSAFKRAASVWGVGRYLYDLEENFAEVTTVRPIRTEGWRFASTKSDDGKKVTFWWRPPALPDWALPKASTGKVTSEHMKQLIAVVHSRGWTSHEVTAVIRRFGFERAADLTLDAFQRVLEVLSKGKPDPTDPPGPLVA